MGCEMEGGCCCGCLVKIQSNFRLGFYTPVGGAIVGKVVPPTGVERDWAAAFRSR